MADTPKPVLAGAKLNTDIVNVTFLKAVDKYRVGETAGFSPDVADFLTGKGVAQLHKAQLHPVFDDRTEARRERASAAA